jgi:hypothetical protein
MAGTEWIRLKLMRPFENSKPTQLQVQATREPSGAHTNRSKPSHDAVGIAARVGVAGPGVSAIKRFRFT